MAAVAGSFDFNEIVVVESLPSGDLKTGTELADGTIRSRLAKAGLNTRLVEVSSKGELFRLLDDLRAECASSGLSPLLQIDAHGWDDGSGICMRDKSDVSWGELAPRLSALNVATRNHLFVILSLCHGAQIAKALQVWEPAPFYAFLAPLKSVKAKDLLGRLDAFYTALLPHGDGTAAIRAFDAAASASAHTSF